MPLKRFSLGYLFILPLIFCCLISSAQIKTTELLGKLNRARLENSFRSDTANVLLLNQLAEQYLYNHADSALYFAKRALQLAEIQKYLIGQAISLKNIGSTYYVLGDYTSSLDISAKLMALSSRIKYRTGIGCAYQIMGLIYLSQDKNEPALVNFTKALQIFIQVKDDGKAGKAYFDIGICYDETGHPEQAFKYLDKAIEMANKVKDDNLLAMTLNRKGETYFHTKDYDKALEYYNQVINSKLTSNWEMDFALSGVAQCYYKLGQYNRAIANAQLSFDLSKKVNSQFDAVRALQILSESYAAAADYKNAYNYQVLFKRFNDGLFNGEKEKEIDYLHLKQQQADNIRLENDIKSKEQALSFSKRVSFFRNLAAVATAIFVIIIFISNRQKTALNKVLKKQNEDIALQAAEISKQKEALDQLNHAKDQMFSVISHDLRSPFAVILQTIGLIRSGDISREEQDVILDSFYRQVSLVGTMVNNLLIWANSQQFGVKSETVTLNITETVNDILSISNFLAKNKNISLLHRYDSDKWVSADLDHVKIIIQNLVGNAIKFTPAGGTIEIYYSEDGNFIATHVKDSGVGIPPEKMEKLFKVTGKEISGYGTNNEAGAGIGLVLIKQFVDANDGKLEIKSKPGEGSEFNVYLKKAGAPPHS